MRQRQYITTFSLIVALTGLSPVVVAEAGTPAGGERIHQISRQLDSPLGYKLSPEQMDGIRGGRINLCADGGCPRPPPIEPHGGGGCNQCPVIWNNGVDGPIIIWDRG